MLTRQLVDLATKLPDYKENIQTKLRSIRVPTGGAFTKFSETVEELKERSAWRRDADSDWWGLQQKPKTSVTLPPKPAPAAASVQVVETSKVNPMGLVQHLDRAATGSAWDRSARVVARYIYAPSARRFAPPAHPANRARGALAPPRTRWTTPARVSFAICLCSSW